MNNLIHARGDLFDMFLFFLWFIFGLWQILVAWKELNGLSLAGYPVRKKWSIAAGIVLMISSGAWYFSQPGHFASPDVEGIETLALLVLGIITATAIQFFLSLIFRRMKYPFGDRTLRRVYQARMLSVNNHSWPERPRLKDLGFIQLSVEVEGSLVPALFADARGMEQKTPVLLIHDYGGTMEETVSLVSFLSSNGHPVIAFDMDGHGKNPRGVSTPFMETTSRALFSALRDRTGSQSIAVIGIGLGGIIAIKYASGNREVEYIVAIDPPVIDADGSCAVNSLRELDILDILHALIYPPAIDTSGKRISLPQLAGDLEIPDVLPTGKITLLSTRDTWLNSPDKFRTFATSLNLEEPLPLGGNHFSLSGSNEAHELILTSIES